MTKGLYFVLALSFFFSAPSFAVPLAGVRVPSPDLAKVGVIAAVKGSVKIDGKTLAGRIAQSGEAVYIGDTVSTDEKGSLQILLLDETIFTIGPNSAIVIDHFVYNPATQSGQVNAKVVKGVFRFVTGKIARKKPSDMKVELPSGTIGVRGTIVIGRTDGAKSTVVLLGPGSKTNTTHRIGQITVGNGNKEVRVTRPGFGSVIEGSDAEPSEPFEVPAEDLAEMTSSLESEDADAGGDEQDSGGDTGEGSDPTEAAGQDTADAAESVDSEAVLNDLFDDAVEEAARASQAALEDEIGEIEDGITTLEDLDRVTTGVFHYSDSSVPLDGGNGDGTYVFEMDIDFGNRTIGGDVANNKIDITVPTADVPNTATYALAEKSFDDAVSEKATFEYNQIDPESSSNCAHCRQADIDISLVNSDGIVANNAAHSIVFEINNGVSQAVEYSGGRESNSRS